MFNARIEIILGYQNHDQSFIPELLRLIGKVTMFCASNYKELFQKASITLKCFNRMLVVFDLTTPESAPHLLVMGSDPSSLVQAILYTLNAH